MGDEVLSCPRVAGEEFRRQQISFESIARGAGQDQVARNVGTPVRERMHVIEGREIELQARATIDAASATVSHCRSLDGAFLMSRGNRLGAAPNTGGSGKGDSVEMPTS